MANEVSNATLLANGGRIAKILAPEIHENLYDRLDGRLLMERKMWMAGGSDTMNVTTVTRAYAAAAATSEIVGGASNTALSTGNYDLTIARYLFQMSPTDLMGITGGVIDPEYVLGVVAETMGLTMTDLACGLFANVSGSVGTSGVNLSVDDWFDAKFYLNLQNNGEMLQAVLHNQQVNDLQSSIRGESGPIQFLAATQEQLEKKGGNFKGSFAGVDIIQSDSVATANAGADRDGCMYAPGAFAYTLGDSTAPARGGLIDPADLLVLTPELFIERKRDADNGITSFILNFYPAVAEQEDLRAVRIVTDA